MMSLVRTVITICLLTLIIAISLFGIVDLLIWDDPIYTVVYFLALLIVILFNSVTALIYIYYSKRILKLLKSNALSTATKIPFFIKASNYFSFYSYLTILLISSFFWVQTIINGQSEPVTIALEIAIGVFILLLPHSFVLKDIIAHKRITPSTSNNISNT